MCVHRTPRIVPMTAYAPPSLLHQVWEYPLFEALYGRRSRRFGLGLRWPKAHSSRGPSERHCRSATSKKRCSLRPGWAFPGLRSGTRAGRSHTVPATAVLSQARNAAAVQHCSSPTIKACTSLTLPLHQRASLGRSKRRMSETRSFRCTGKTARRCGKAGSTFLAVYRRSRGTICGFRTCPVRRCSCRFAT